VNKLKTADFIDNDLTVFFSLPFYPVKNKTYFFHGHFALGLEDKVYQIYNPKMLKSDFLISIMPKNEWLYGNSKFWVDRNKNSKTYKHVHLYKKSELNRTTVFYAGLTNLDKYIINHIKNYFDLLENKYKNGKLKFNFFTNNCASLLNNIFYDQNWLNKELLDNIPSVIFRRLIEMWKKNKMDFNLGKLSKLHNNDFNVHKFCIGIPSLSSERFIDNWIKKIN
jgi:hypothetical protein